VVRFDIMSRDDTELLASVLRLPQAVRAQFAQEILASLDGSAEADVGELWQAEIERRAEEVFAGRAELEDADAVHARITARLRDRSR
jgi:putative addiction module component (TIGR02574 family)